MQRARFGASELDLCQAAASAEGLEAVQQAVSDLGDWVEQLTDTATQRLETQRLLELLRAADPPVLPRLVELLGENSSDEDMTWTMITVVNLFVSHSTEEQMQWLLDAGAVPSFGQLLGTSMKDVDDGVCIVLLNIATVQPAAVLPLLPALSQAFTRDDDDELLDSIMSLLVKFSSTDDMLDQVLAAEPPVLPRLIELLRYSSEDEDMQPPPMRSLQSLQLLAAIVQHSGLERVLAADPPLLPRLIELLHSFEHVPEHVRASSAGFEQFTALTLARRLLASVIQHSVGWAAAVALVPGIDDRLAAMRSSTLSRKHEEEIEAIEAALRSRELQQHSPGVRRKILCLPTTATDDECLAREAAKAAIETEQCIAAEAKARRERLGLPPTTTDDECLAREVVKGSQVQALCVAAAATEDPEAWQAGAELAARLVDPKETTAAQLEAAVEAGCISSLVKLLARCCSEKSPAENPEPESEEDHRGAPGEISAAAWADRLMGTGSGGAAAAARALGTIALGLPRPVERVVPLTTSLTKNLGVDQLVDREGFIKTGYYALGNGRRVPNLEGALATDDGIRWGKIIIYAFPYDCGPDYEGDVDLQWLDDGSVTSSLPVQTLRSIRFPYQTDLVPTFQCWACRLVAAGADAMLATAAAHWATAAASPAYCEAAQLAAQAWATHRATAQAEKPLPRDHSQCSARSAAEAAEAVLRVPGVVTASLAARLPALAAAAEGVSCAAGAVAIATVAAVIGAGGATAEQLEAAAVAILEAGFVGPLLDLCFGGGSSGSGLGTSGAEAQGSPWPTQLHAAIIVATLCGQAKRGEGFSRRLVAAGLNKDRLVVVAAAIEGPEDEDVIGSGSYHSSGTPAEQAKYKLEQLLRDTELLTALAAAEKAVAEEATAKDEVAAALTEEGTLELVRTRMARSLSPDQMGLADVLAPHVLASRRHRAATCDMVDGGSVTCDCVRFVARFQGTNRPRDDAAEDIQPWCCSNCKAELPEDRVALEEAEKLRCEGEDTEASGGNSHADRLHSFGVSVEFILAVTVAFDCWTWPTWKVQRDIIRPLCLAGGRCRFAELPWVIPHVGPANVFISHTWSAMWGTLVAAVLDGAAPSRLVWIDNVAVRQFPGNSADLDFDGVIKRCKAVLLVAQALPGVAGLRRRDRFKSELMKEGPQKQHALAGCAGSASRFQIAHRERSLIAACRVWCLAEINAAMKHNKPLVVKAGSATRRRTVNTGGSVAERVHFLPDTAMLSNMSSLIDVEKADATVLADKEMIMGWIKAAPGGTAAMNSRIATAMQNAYELAQLFSSSAAAMHMMNGISCGEQPQLGLLDAVEKAEVLCCVAKLGRAAEVRALLMAGASTEAVDATGMTPWRLAIQHGHAEVITVLLSEGGVDLEGRLNPDDRGGITPLGMAVYFAQEGHAEAVQALIVAGADLEAKGPSGSTPLELAVCLAKKADRDGQSTSLLVYLETAQLLWAAMAAAKAVAALQRLAFARVVFGSKVSEVITALPFVSSTTSKPPKRLLLADIQLFLEHRLASSAVVARHAVQQAAQEAANTEVIEKMTELLRPSVSVAAAAAKMTENIQALRRELQGLCLQDLHEQAKAVGIHLWEGRSYPDNGKAPLEQAMDDSQPEEAVIELLVQQHIESCFHF